MAVPPKQSKRSVNRKSKNNDFFHKMLALEKQTNQQRQRSASNSPTHGHAHSPSVTSMTGFHLNMPGQSAPHRGRSEVKPPEPLRIVTKSVSQDSLDQSDICQSPSWDNERKRKEKEQKELKKAENRKPPKRLSKQPPPAAMDTQADLRRPRRNSLSSLFSSRPSSREPSLERKDEKRLSGSSFTQLVSGRRSSSRQRDSESDYKSIVSPIAPKIPSFRWKGSGEKHASFDEGLVSFPYEKQAEKETVQKQDQDQDQEPISHLAQGRAIRPMTRSATEPLLEKKPIKSALKTSKAAPKEQGKSHKHQQSDEIAAELIAMLSDKAPSPLKHASKPAPPSTKDGGSYVHKQRMYQQQRSIAGFEEQQTLQLFNEQATVAAMQQDIRDVKAAKKEIVRSREPSPISSRNRSSSRGPSERRSSTSPSGRTAPSKQPAMSPLKQVSSAPEDSDDDEQERKLKRAKEEIAHKMQNIQTTKTEKILGFRKRKDSSTTNLPANASEASEPVSKSKNRISAHLPFRNRRDSSSSRIALGDQSAEARRSNIQLAKIDTKPVSDPVPQSKDSSDSSDSWHSTKEKPKINSLKARQDANALAAAYSEGIKTPSSEESLAEPEKERKSPELVVKSVSDGIERKASITRPRSNPNLHQAAANAVPNLDFLPQLKHQPLPKSPRRMSNQNSSTESSPTRIKIPPPPAVPDTSYHSPTKLSPDLTLMPRSPLRQAVFPDSNAVASRSATSIATPTAPNAGKSKLAGVDAKPVAKLFVICCKCKFWHDLPSKLYEAMAMSKELQRKDDFLGGKERDDKVGKKMGDQAGKMGDKILQARLETVVRCPWCEHGMSTSCCQGWTTVVYLHERHH